MIEFRATVPREVLQTAAGGIAAQFGARLVVLFGSAARGEATPEDLDVGMLAPSPFDDVAATNAFTRDLNTQDVDVTDLRRADPVLLALVARDGVPLFEREPGEFSRFVSLAVRRFADTRKFREAQAAALRDAVRTQEERR